MKTANPGVHALARHMTEDQLLGSVLDLAATYHWKAHHCRAARLANGKWVTPIQGNPGFPDLVLAHPSGRLIFAELKRHGEKPTAAQRLWLSTLDAGPAEVHTWWPADWLSGDIRRAMTMPQVAG